MPSGAATRCSSTMPATPTSACAPGSSPSSTHDAATNADLAQYAVEEGPCLDAIDEPKVYSPSFPDPRWPALGERPTRYGVESILSYRLTPAHQNAVGAALPGSLNTYAQE